VTDRKIIAFRKRAPSEGELEAYRRMTRNWAPALRQLLLPEYFSREEQVDESHAADPKE
jgi:hypothetical protein